MKLAVLQDDFPPYHQGGTGVIAYQLAKEFSKKGHQVLVITTTQERARAGVTEVEGMRVVRLFSDYDERFRSYRSLYNRSVIKETELLLKDFSPDVVHVHNVHLHLSYYSIVLARKYGRRVYMTAHDAMSFHIGKLPFGGAYGEPAWQQFATHKWRYNPLRNRIIHHILRANVDKIIAVSGALKEALNANNIDNVEVIHNGIDVADWEAPVDTASFAIKHTIGAHAVLFGGRLSEAKGAFKILDSLALIKKTLPDAQLLVIGKRDVRAEEMIAYAGRLGIAGAIVFTGWIGGSNLRAAYHAASVATVPSLYLDPFPTINLEAFACGKPVVATCFGGSPEIVDEGVNGYVVDPFEVDAMAARITDLLNDKEKNEVFGRAGYERVTHEFSLARQMSAYERLFVS